jgi:hypothetical protein
MMADAMVDLMEPAGVVLDAAEVVQRGRDLVEAMTPIAT